MDKVSKPSNRRFYDQGWNDRVDNQPLLYPCSESYKEGWNDCDFISDKDRIYFPNIPYPDYDEAKL